ncbi:uncharacterized protein LOC142170618 [Nicotiana tabacum]|uniref:Uncharacterized protein LOC142170618 n=1 Tax=Nicotiana tabacum TaxID=4097 RepID=A0AC58SUF3_TOBAC
MVVLENRVKETNADSIIKKVFSTWKWIANYDAAPGDKKALWEDMRGTITGISGPSVMVGDYNTILTSEDRVQGNGVQEFEVRDFKEFILDVGLTELRTEFEDTVKQYWIKVSNGNAMFKVWNKLKLLTVELKQLNSLEFNNIGHKIQAPRSKLEGIQVQILGPVNDSEIIAQEKVIKMELAKWLEVEESILKQKSRIKWLKLGDLNTAYFHACIKNRQETNHIGSLVDSAGQLLQSPTKVELEMLNFCKLLLGTSEAQIPAINTQVMQQGDMLSRQQQMQLIRTVIGGEIKQAIQD